MNDYGPEKNTGYRDVLVVIDKFSKFDWTLAIKNRNAQTKKDSFEKILTSSKRKLNLTQTDRGKEFLSKIFINLSDNNNIKTYSRNPAPGAVVVQRFNSTIRDLLKNPFLKEVTFIGFMYYPQ